ncbi:non-ribosomal peptide synthetase (plasmid) [Brasilonema octagenarum UFV-E1]|uniref:Non-ribosomal peptide synthetase n=2 Tax=Brasilonema TaxID=383614 RepID=A0A856MTS2_9CYAN|nr:MULTISPECIES: non-ribosomal peptide synthetase [Brasilonema]NMF62564.1 non-ribosomal peptide synthetase [Brasilonema octagenarum UFV-OR1]QDL12656.1 non-ribosomal peptide synthetase [Brasilonema sennae CENA114]QDL19050.1 non-ribosomal peptide synthetase [Brasilonema octagenarum UFV-E1]
MKATELLTELRQLGVQLWIDGQELICRAPKGTLTPELRTLMAQQKSELLALLHFHDKETRSSTLPTIVPALDQRHLPFPLTEIQQAYWLGRNGAFELGNVGNHFYVELECEELDLNRLSSAWQKVISRHDMLRAVVTADAQQQILEQVPPYQIEIQDLRAQEPETVAQRLEAARDRLSHQLFQPEQWPWFEVQAYLLDERRIRLLISIELLNLDVTSATMIFREWWQLYKNPELSLPALEFSFRDYILATDAFRKSEAYQRSLAYWKERVATLPPAPELSLAINPNVLNQPKFKCHKATLEAETWSKLKNRAVEMGLSPSGVLLAAYAEILATWSKNLRFTINLTLFNRLPLHPKINDIAGDFTSLILLAVDNSGQYTFAERAKHIQKQLWDDMDHCHVSGVQVLRELSRLQSREREAVMPVIFTSALNSSSDGIFEWLNKFGSVVYSISQTPQVWLDYQAHEQGGSLINVWATVEGLFPEGLLDDMLNAYNRLLQRLANHKESWQQKIFQLIPKAQLERRTAINATQAPVTSHMLHTLFAEQVPQRSQQPAVISSKRTLNYLELYRRAHQVGHRLRQLGAHPNTLVGVVMEKGWEQVVAVLGILYSGAAYLPIDPALPQERLWHLLEQGEVKLVLTQSWLNEKLTWSNGIQRLGVDDEDIQGVDDSPLESVQKPEDLAYVIFTSGSTGTPKGVMIDHRGAVNTIVDINQRFGVEPTDRVLALSSLNFDLSVYDIFGTLAAGGTIVIPDAEHTKDPAHWVALMAQNKVTVWNSVPALMQMLVEYSKKNQHQEWLNGLQLVLLSGDWIPLNLPNQIKALFKNAQVISLGGATEASIWSILYPIEAVDLAWKSIPYGQPMCNQYFQILNEKMEPCPVWVPGQVYIGGIGLAQGYWRDEQKTNTSFIIHPETGERLYKTGDLGRYLPDGNIEFLGREDLQVKISGYRIELGEIEKALEQHSAVKYAVVTAVGKEREKKYLVAYVVPDSEWVSLELDFTNPIAHVYKPQQPEGVMTNQGVSEQVPPKASSTFASIADELHSFLQKKLPNYMIPSAYVPLPTLPLSANGKVDRRALPQLEPVHSESDTVNLPPQSEVERTLAAIVKNVLQVESIGMQSNFFDLGATSVHIVQVHSKVKEALGMDIPIVQIFRYPTISFLAKYLSHNQIEKSFSHQMDEQTQKQKELSHRQKQLMAKRRNNTIVNL